MSEQMVIPTNARPPRPPANAYISIDCPRCGIRTVGVVVGELHLYAARMYGPLEWDGMCSTCGGTATASMRARGEGK